MSEAIDVYLKTGDHDPMFSAWPGDGFSDRLRKGSDSLRDALIAEVMARTRSCPSVELPENLDIRQCFRRKLGGMVAGLFPKAEQATVLAMLEQSVIFLTHRNFASVVRDMAWLGTAWDLANLYLASRSAGLLSEDAPAILGLSIETTCYVSTDYFHATDRLEDFVVHEAAHVFHNCKREALGLPHSRHREWLLEIDYGKRETFAYACEAYNRLIELGRDTKHRQDLLAELAAAPLPSDERVVGAEYLDILAEAVTARNGWKRILARCSPAESRRQQGSPSIS